MLSGVYLIHKSMPHEVKIVPRRTQKKVRFVVILVGLLAETFVHPNMPCNVAVSHYRRKLADVGK